AIEHLAGVHVNDAGTAVALIIHRDQRLMLYTQDATHFAAVGGFLKGGDQFVFGRGFFDVGDEIDQGDSGGGNAHGKAIKLAFEFRDHQRHSFSRTRGGRDHVHSGSTGTTQILVRQVKNLLVVGV